MKKAGTKFVAWIELGLLIIVIAIVISFFVLQPPGCEGLVYFMKSLIAIEAAAVIGFIVSLVMVIRTRAKSRLQVIALIVSILFGLFPWILLAILGEFG